MTAYTKLYSLLAAAICFSLVSFQATAQEDSAAGETSVDVIDLQKDKPPGQADVADEVITNRKLRAETGSLSKWSVSTAWSYSGGSIENPLEAERPNIHGQPGDLSLQTLAGSVGVKYRTSSLTSLSLDLGLRMVTPFHTSINTEDEGLREQFRSQDDELDVNDPSLSFTGLWKSAGIQNVSQLGVGVYTTDYRRDFLNGVGGVSASNTSVYDFGGSPFTVGVLVTAFYDYYDGDTGVTSGGDEVDVRGGQADYGGGIYPLAEYVINDTFNLRTISGVWVYNHVRSADANTYIKNNIYQSVGLGISVTRDIYLYPNVQFLPEDIRGDRTNWALNANVNIF